MRKIIILSLSFCALISMSMKVTAQAVPEILWYTFDETGTTVTNQASNPPAGTATATILGGITQGGNGFCETALVGSGIASSTDYVNTGWATDLGTGSWTISFWTSNIAPSATLFYIWGDVTAGSLRCFTNGVAGAGNWLLRGTGMTDVNVTGAAIVSPTMTAFVYDSVAGNIYAYVNGTLVNTVAQGIINISGTGPFKVSGYSSSVGLPTNGYMDDFRVYDRAISAAEVTEIYNQTNHFVSITESAFCEYTSPSGNHVWNTSGIYNDTLVNAIGCDTIVTIDLTIFNSVGDSVMAPLPAHSTTFSGNTRGYWFVAPVDFVIKGLRVPDEAGAGNQNIEVLRFNSPVPNYATVTNDFTSLFYINNYLGTGIIDTEIAIYAGDIIGILGVRGTTNSYAPSPNTTIIGGNTVDIFRLGFQDQLQTIQAYDVWTESGSSISRVEFYYQLIDTTIMVCDSYTWNASTYTTSGIYSQTFTTGVCDSTSTVNLIVSQSSSSDTSAIECDTFIWFGDTLTSTGDYTHTFTNAVGCDSVITLHLTIEETPFAGIDSTANVCSTTDPEIDLYDYLGSTYSTGGTWSDDDATGALTGSMLNTTAVTQGGTYHFTYLVAGSLCSDDDATVTLTIDTCSTENIGKFKSIVNVMPNPTTGYVEIQTDYSGQQHITVYSFTGHVIFDKVFSGNVIVLNFSEFSDGTYFFRIVSDNKTSSGVIILKKE